MCCDVCYTSHADADQNSNDDLLRDARRRGLRSVMGVPDVMLNYQSTSYHDVASIRRLLGLRPAPELEAWFECSGLWDDGGPVDVLPSTLQQLSHALGTPFALPAESTTA
jgi:ethanolamine ammonia-lyase large subunit